MNEVIEVSDRMFFRADEIIGFEIEEPRMYDGDLFRIMAHTKGGSRVEAAVFSKGGWSGDVPAELRAQDEVERAELRQKAHARFHELKMKLAASRGPLVEPTLDRHSQCTVLANQIVSISFRYFGWIGSPAERGPNRDDWLCEVSFVAVTAYGHEIPIETRNMREQDAPVRMRELAGRFIR